MFEATKVTELENRVSSSNLTVMVSFTQRHWYSPYHSFYVNPKNINKQQTKCKFYNYFASLSDSMISMGSIFKEMKRTERIIKDWGL